MKAHKKALFWAPFYGPRLRKPARGSFFIAADPELPVVAFKKLGPAAQLLRGVDKTVLPVQLQLRGHWQR